MTVKTANCLLFRPKTQNVLKPQLYAHDHYADLGRLVRIEPKSVNMADLFFSASSVRDSHAASPNLGSPRPQSENQSQPDVQAAQANPPDTPIDLIELLFFAYRDFVAGPDTVLSGHGFGRAHHRVLHFVSRSPGLRVSDLLTILKITKQSLAPVLKQLLDSGHIRQERSQSDGRERLLYATEAGNALILELTALQSAQFERAFVAAGLDARTGTEPRSAREIIAAFLLGMTDPEARAQIAAQIGRDDLAEQMKSKSEAP